MNKIKIMQSSVDKWNRIIAGKSSDGGVLDCPPCRIFYPLICTGCPIAEYGGKKFCRASPYPEWYHHQNNVHGFLRRKIYCPECLRLATAMRDYQIEIVNYLKQKEAAKKQQKSSAESDERVNGFS